jgi:hypothetical protein
MVNKVERERRKVLLSAIKSEECLRAEEELPAPKSMLDLLFEWLDEKLRGAECDNTLRLTLEFAQLHRLDEKRLCSWTEKYGGYCDCEVLANVPDTNPVFRS